MLAKLTLMTVTHASPSGWIVSVKPDPLALAQRLEQAGAPHVALLHHSELGLARGFSYVAAYPDKQSQLLDPTEDDDGSAAPVASLLGASPRWIGVIPYEARRALERPRFCQPDGRPKPLLCEPCWLRYPALFRIDPRSGTVMLIGREHAARQRLYDALRGGEPQATVEPLIEIGDDEPAEQHLVRVKRALELICAGDIYQVTLARRLGVRQSRGSSLDLYGRLAATAPSAFGAYLALPEDTAVLSTSPELLLQALPGVAPEGDWPAFDRLCTEPIKGTRPRGADARADHALLAELAADPKERAELSMIIDVERNDLARVSKVGSVRVVRPPHVVTHRTVHHRKARIVSAARSEISRAEVIASMVPSGSVTGAPKVRAMEVIRELETHRRGLYTGAIGFVAHDGTVSLSMAIRTLVMRKGAGHYWTGGGIVVDSDPNTELRETVWKAEQLRRTARRTAPPHHSE